MNMPVIRKAEQFRRYRLGPYEAALLHQIESVGKVEYLYILTVMDPAAGEAVLFVTAEVNALAELVGGGSHFLCVFHGESRSNLGEREGLAELETFAHIALETAARRLNVSGPLEVL